MFAKCLACAFMLALLLAGCRPQAAASPEVDIQLELTPHPPQVGTAQVVLIVSDPTGRPLEAESLDVEGNMNHAGMKPVFSTLKQTSPGRYEGALEFTMAGDWFLLVTGPLADGLQLNEKIDVPGVQRP